MNARLLSLSLLILLVVPAWLYAVENEQEEIAAVQTLSVSPEQSVFDDATRQKPIELASAEDAKKYFTGDALTALNKAVNWDKQVVLVFAWRGSGQDKLEARTEQDDQGKTSVVFAYTPGRTRDLRPHTYVYGVRKGVTWSTK